MTYAAELVRLYVAILLLAAATGKALGRRDFEETIGALFGLAKGRLAAAALAVIGAEGLIALALFAAGGWARAGMAAAVALFALFGAVLLVALAKGRAVRCNCFGGGAHLISALDLARNGALAAAGCFYLLAPPGPALGPAMQTMLLGVAIILVLLTANPFRPAQATPLPIGEPVPPFAGQAAGRRIDSAELAGQAIVLAFLSVGCPACRDKAAEIARLLPAMNEAGVRLWIVAADAAHGIAPLIAGTPLAGHELTLDAAARRPLNPRNIAPFYLFLDDLVVQASGAIGDPDWQSFVAQIEELDAAPEAVRAAGH